MTLHDLLLELTSDDDLRAEVAALSVGNYGPQVLSVLGPLLHSSNPDYRWWAVRSLAELPDEGAGSLLIEALADPDPSVRQCSALSLSRRPDEDAVPALVEAMGSKDALLARLAANALASTGASAVPALLDVLENGPQPVRLEAARALAHIGDERSIPLLFKALEEDSALMDYWANEALERMGVGMMFFKP
jgi:HEAT repeat protein